MKIGKMNTQDGWRWPETSKYLKLNLKWKLLKETWTKRKGHFRYMICTEEEKELRKLVKTGKVTMAGMMWENLRQNCEVDICYAV